MSEQIGTRVKMETAAPPVMSRNLPRQRQWVLGGKATPEGTRGNCQEKRSAVSRSANAPEREAYGSAEATTAETLSRGRGHDFGQMRVRSDRSAAEPGISLGELKPGKETETPALDGQPKTLDAPQTLPGADTAERMDTTPAKGPAIAVTNGWNNPAGKNDRTTVGIGELSSFVVNDSAGGSWKSADGKGKTNNSVSFQWTASAKGTNDITYTAANKSTSSVTMTTEVPKNLTGHNDGDLSFSAATQGAGMNLTITVNPTTVSFQALELMEGICGPSAVSGYFVSHTPKSHDAAAGAGTWNSVGPDNDVSDTADSNGWPSPWSKGSYTWAIPANWRLKSSQTSTAFSKTSDQVIDITGNDGTTVVSKLGAKTSPRKP